MFEVVLDGSLATGDGSAAAAEGLPSVGEVLGFADALAAGGTAGWEDAERVELLRALEVLKNAAAGAQAVATACFEDSQRERAAAAGVPAERRGRGIGHQVGLARRESPHRGQRHLGLARVLTDEMPHTLHALRGGFVTEWEATLLARETACLSRADRAHVDAALCADPEAAAAMGTRELGDRARALAGELDPAAVADRRRAAEADRGVSLRPAPETMTWLTGHLPVKDGVAVYAALKAAADRLAGVGDGRSRGQLMADTLVDRVLGRTTPAAGTPPDPPTGTPGSPAGTPPDSPAGAPGVTVNVVIGLDALLGDGGQAQQAAQLPGYGPVPAETVRDWLRDHAASPGGSGVWWRRLFADPATGQLVAMESAARAFPPGLAQFLTLRDLRCRTPWCDAPVRHADHVRAHADHGPTTAANGQGLCEACNHAKEAPGWQARPRPGPPGHEVETTTPTGHRYRSRAPAHRAPTRPPSHEDERAPTPRTDLFWAA